jgi:PAS domain S-box-containing protein
MDSQSFSVLFYMSVAIGAALVCGMAWAAVCFMRNSFPVLWPLRIVAKIGQFCASVLYIPVLTMLLSAFNCQDRSVNPFWAQVGLNCWGSAYTAQAAIIALLTLAFILVCALFSLVFYDWHPLTTNLAGRVHGRVEFVFILIKTVLVILIEIFPESVNEWILQGAVLAAGLCWVGMYLYALPFVHHHMNLLNVAFGTALTFMAVCGLVAQGYPAWDGGVALYLGVPLAGLLGAKLASDRIMRLAVKPVMSLGSAYEVELNARLLLNSIVFGNPMGKGFPNIIAYATRAGAVLTKDKSESTAAASGLARAANFASKLGRGAPTLATRVMNEAATKARNALQRIKSSSTLLRPLGRDSRHMDDGAGNNGGTTHRSRHTRRDDASGFRRNSSMATLNMAMNDPRGTPGGGQGGGGDPSSSAIPIGRSFPPPMTELGARPPGAQSAPVGEVPESLRQLSDSLETEDDIDLRVRAVQKHLPREAVDALEQTYITGSTCFRNSAMLHLIWARFYSVFRPNQHLEASHMLQAQRDDAGFDVQYFVFATQKANEDSGGGGKGSMSALSRVSYEKHLADARRLVIRAMQRQVVYWSEMLEETPTLNRLHRISADLTRAMKNAEESFRQTLSFSPQSVIALRLMATYQMYVNCDNEKSQALLADADRIEEQQAKEAQEERGASLRVMQEVGHSESDNMAIITISALPDSLGIIRSVNAASIRMFGWSKWQMERRNVNMLVPEPFSEMHDLALQIYLQSGESTVVDRCRVVLGMHQSGHIFPMLMSVRETSLNEGVSPTFVAMIRPLQSEEQHILLDSDFNVRSATASSCDILGVEPAELASSPWNLADFCHDFLSKAEDLLGGRQCVLTIRKHIREEESDGSGIDTDGEIESDGTGSTLNLLGHARPRAKQSQVPRPKPKGQGFTFEQHRPNNVQTTIKVELQTVVPRSTGSIIYCMYWTPFNTNKRAPVLPAKSSTNLRESSQGAPSSSRPMMGCPVMRSTNQGQQPPSGVMNGKPPQGIPPMRPPVSEHRGTATAGHETVDTAGQKIVSFDGASPVPDSAADSDRSLQLADSDSLSEVDADRLGGLHAAPGGHVLGPVPRRAGTPPMKNRLSEGIFPRDSRSSRADSEGMASTDLPKGRNDLSLAENGFSSEANGYPVSIMQKQAFMATAGFSRSAPQADRSVGGSSRGSTSQRTLGRLRKMLSSSRQPLLRSLVWLRNVGMIGLVVAVAVAISFVMTLIKSFRQYHDNIDASRASAEISMFVSHLTYEANTLVLARENMLDWDNETDFAIRDDMFRCAQKFAVSHRELNAMASAGGAIAPEAYSG